MRNMNLAHFLDLPQPHPITYSLRQGCRFGMLDAAQSSRRYRKMVVMTNAAAIPSA
jgi:hypothetical protein